MCFANQLKPGLSSQQQVTGMKLAGNFLGARMFGDTNSKIRLSNTLNTIRQNNPTAMARNQQRLTGQAAGSTVTGG